MKKLTFIASLLAALAGVGVGHVYLQRLEAEVSGGPRVAVLVAAEDIPFGAELSEKVLAVRDVPRAFLETRHVRASELEKVLGARVAAGLKASDALLWTDLAQFSDHSRVLSGLVPSGMRAVIVDARTAEFEGLLRPGDRVDVLLTTGAKEAGGTTVTLLQNLLVLSVGGSVTRDEDVSRSLQRSTGVTVSATLEQAQVLTQAQQRGRVTLTLRNPGDIALVEGVPETSADSIVAAKDRFDWQSPSASAKKAAIEHVR